MIIAHDLRSTHNVGALFRTADCFGVAHLYCSGYTPYPALSNDTRLPHIRDKLARQIDKTALGATKTVSWSYEPDITELLQTLTRDGYVLVGLEQTSHSLDISAWTPPDKIVLLLGREVEGVDERLLHHCQSVIEIPQFGAKESLNVVQAAAIALYHIRFAPLQ